MDVSLSSALLVWGVRSLSAAFVVALHLSLGVRSRRAGSGWLAAAFVPWPGAWRGGARARVVVWWALLVVYAATWWVGHRLP